MVGISSQAHGAPVFYRLGDGDGDDDDGAAAPGTASVRRRAGRRSEVPNAWVSRCRMESCSCHVARFGIARSCCYHEFPISFTPARDTLFFF
jgi:hypothetical protein